MYHDVTEIGTARTMPFGLPDDFALEMQSARFDREVWTAMAPAPAALPAVVAPAAADAAMIDEAEALAAMAGDGLPDLIPFDLDGDDDTTPPPARPAAPAADPLDAALAMVAADLYGYAITIAGGRSVTVDARYGIGPHFYERWTATTLNLKGEGATPTAAVAALAAAVRVASRTFISCLKPANAA